MSRHDVGMAHLADRLGDTETAGVEITYRRGAASVTFVAEVGFSLLRVSSPGGVARVVRTDRDFNFAASRLVLSGSVTEPATGDTIDATIGGVTRRYKLLPPGQDEPAWRYSDPLHVAIRWHGKYQGTV